MSDQVFSKVDLREDGILWMLNSTVFHPRGLALGVDSTGQLFLQGDGDEVWVFEEDLAEKGFAAFTAMVDHHLAKFPGRP